MVSDNMVKEARRLTVAWLGALLRHVAELIAVPALDLPLLRAVLGKVAFSAAVVAGTSTTALGAVLGEMTNWKTC